MTSHVDQIREYLLLTHGKAKAADSLICDLASGRKKWNMCIPPQADDTDMVLIELPRTTLPLLVDALSKAVGALEEFQLSHKHSEGESYIRKMGDTYGWCDYCSEKVSYGPGYAEEALAGIATILEGGKK